MSIFPPYCQRFPTNLSLYATTQTSPLDSSLPSLPGLAHLFSPLSLSRADIISPVLSRRTALLVLLRLLFTSVFSESHLIPEIAYRGIFPNNDIFFPQEKSWYHFLKNFLLIILKNVHLFNYTHQHLQTN